MQNLKIIAHITSAFLRHFNKRYELSSPVLNGLANTATKKLNNNVPTKLRGSFRPFKINLFTLYLYAIELLYTFYK